MQSLLSINQIGLGIWGWSLSGLLIGYFHSSTALQDKNFSKGNRTKKIPKKLLSTSGFAVLIAVVFFGAALSIPPYIASTKFYSALQSGNVDILESSAYLKPYDRSRFFYVALILKENNRNEEALRTLRSAVRIYPDYYSAWLEISKNPSASEEVMAIAEKEINRLEPRLNLMNKGIQN